MSHPINRYKADLREFRFQLFELFMLEELLGKEPFADWGEEEANLLFEQAYRFATEVTGPLNAVGDQGCRLENGQVLTPPGFKDAWQKLYERGYKSLWLKPEHGGQGAPRSMTALVGEMLSGSNAAFEMYGALTLGAAEVIASFGTEEQRKIYCERMCSGTWSGTMCLTESHAGSDVGLASTRARKNADGSYAIKGTKTFISGGDHELTENIVHLVLARIEGAERGTKGLSLFIVPKMRVDANGKITGPNDVKVASIEHKMGINGSATCVLNFGEDDGCAGWLVGGQEHQGIKQMFLLMNFARLGVGVQGLSVASTAYLNAVEYARNRKQGTSIEQVKDPEAPRVSIIEHADVRRMLLDMKARVEGIRSLIVKTAMHYDRAQAKKGNDDDGVVYDLGQVELLTPLVKAYASDQAFRVCETAIQVYGGVGYTKDFPVEQYCRDAKIFSIYEGTNHIQSLDLVVRKLGQRGGANMQAFLGDVQSFIEANRNHEPLGGAVARLARAHEAIGSCAMQFLGWSQGGEMNKVPLTSTRFLGMMGELAVGWLLLEGAAIAVEAQKKLDKAHPDFTFYEGKKHAAIYWAHNVLAGVPASAEILRFAVPRPWSAQPPRPAHRDVRGSIFRRSRRRRPGSRGGSCRRAGAAARDVPSLRSCALISRSIAAATGSSTTMSLMPMPGGRCSPSLASRVQTTLPSTAHGAVSPTTQMSSRAAGRLKAA
jgi:alkylation response protein AidB-like acyl-CoA dehydrogenase